jgi:membrane protein
MITALNAVYEKDETRSYLRFQLSALILALCSIIFALVALCLSTVVPIALSWFPLGEGTRETVSLIRWIVLAALIALGIAGIYRFAPAQDGKRQGWVVWGVSLTTVVWIGSSELFALYVTNVASYDASYGSFGAVVVLLLWVYIAVFVVLLGAELNAELKDRTEIRP